MTAMTAIYMTAIYPGGAGAGRLLAHHHRRPGRHRRGTALALANRGLLRPRPQGHGPHLLQTRRLHDPVLFDPVRFGMPPNALPSTDSAQLLELIAARKLLDEATRGGVEVDLDRVDVVLGVASATELVVQMGSWMQRPIWRKAMLEDGLPEDEAEEICRDIADLYPAWQESTFPGLLVDVVAGRIAYRLDLGGSNFVVDAACASSLLALQASLHRLYLHESDMVLTGRVDALNDVMMFMCFSKTPAFSPTGDRRPFSDAADGTIVGEGVGMVALKRLDDAERDGNPIYAVIRGVGSSSDGRAASVYAPRSDPIPGSAPGPPRRRGGGRARPGNPVRPAARPPTPTSSCPAPCPRSRALIGPTRRFSVATTSSRSHSSVIAAIPALPVRLGSGAPTRTRLGVRPRPRFRLCICSPDGCSLPGRQSSFSNSNCPIPQQHPSPTSARVPRLLPKSGLITAEELFNLAMARQ
ncbi:MAG: beta-ketoacyl synthase N-terminal-like domain-containing protein [Mycobacterium sp.]